MSCLPPVDQFIDFGKKRKSNTCSTCYPSGSPFLVPFLMTNPRDITRKNFFVGKKTCLRKSIDESIMACFPPTRTLFISCTRSFERPETTEKEEDTKKSTEISPPTVLSQSFSFNNSNICHIIDGVFSPIITHPLSNAGIQAKQKKREQNYKKTHHLVSDKDTNEISEEELENREMYGPLNLITSIKEEIFSEIQKNFAINPNCYTYSEHFYMFSYILKYSHNPYDILRALLPFPSRQSLSNYFDDDLKKIKNRLQSEIKSNKIINQLIPERKEVVKLVISIDAIDIKLFKKDNNLFKSIFIFYALPIHRDLKSFPIYAKPHPTGKTNALFRTTINNIITSVNKAENIYAPIRAVDGETGHNIEHNNEFSEFFDVYKHEGFDSLINYIREKIESGKAQLIITDMIHFGKNRRTQFIFQDLVINEKKVNLAPLFSILDKSGSMNDKSALSKLQDQFPVELFNFVVLSKLFYHKALFLFFFPISCWMEAALNQQLDKESRLYLLKCACLTYMKAYMHQEESKKKNEFQPQTSLKRAINTLSILYEEFESCGDYFPWDRYGTMVQEHFHGNVRGLNPGNDDCETLMNSIAKSAIIFNLKPQIGLKNTARTRLSVGGIHWEESIHTKNAIPNKNGVSYLPEHVVDVIWNDVYSPSDDSQIIKESIHQWIRDVSESTFRLKTSFATHRGRSILSRQVTNSVDFKKKYIKDPVTNEIKDSDEEKREFFDIVNEFNNCIDLDFNE